MCGWLLNSMKTSGPEPDWMAAVTRGCRSLPFTVSRLILMPSAFIASGSIDLRSSSSDADIKRALRRGENPNGVKLAPIMPTGFYEILTERDVDAIVADLRTVPAVKNEVAAPIYKTAF